MYEHNMKYFYRSWLRTREDREAFASPAGSLKVKIQQCILKNKELFWNLAQLQSDRNPFSKICKLLIYSFFFNLKKT